MSLIHSHLPNARQSQFYAAIPIINTESEYAYLNPLEPNHASVLLSAHAPLLLSDFCLSSGCQVYKSCFCNSAQILRVSGQMK